MRGNVCCWVMLGLSNLLACFHDASVLGSRAMAPRVIALSLRDAQGAAWPPRNGPRWPRFELELESALPVGPNTVVPVYLVAGVADDELVADLADPPLREASQAALLPLTVTVSSSATHVVGELALPLRAGAEYSLVWAAAAEAQVFQVRVSSSPSAGAALAESWPAAGAREVPPNLQRMLLRFDGQLSAVPALWLRGPGQARTEIQAHAQDCRGAGFPPGECIWLDWGGAALAAQSSYALISEGGPWQDATGATLPLPELAFETGLEADHVGPTALDLSCALDESGPAGVCALAFDGALFARTQASEPVLAELLAPPQRASALGFEEPLALGLSGLSAAGCVFLRLSDLAGNRSELPFCLAMPQDLATLSIDEVRVDPLGPEPAQEFVELLNFGPQPVTMNGYFLSDDPFSKGHELRLVGAVLPGERVLLVGPAFERESPVDGALPSAVRVVRLERALSLPNEGSALFLRDPQGRRLSASPRIAPSRAGQCLVRVGAEARSGQAAAFALDPSGGCTPGAATDVSSLARPGARFDSAASGLPP